MQLTYWLSQTLLNSCPHLEHYFDVDARKEDLRYSIFTKYGKLRYIWEKIAMVYSDTVVAPVLLCKKHRYVFVHISTRVN